jgi:hypothetical protein
MPKSPIYIRTRKINYYYERKRMKKTCAFKNGRQTNFVGNSLVKYFFYSADMCTRFARAANFPSRKNSITLLTCYINNYFYKFCMQLVSKVFFFYSADLCTRFARAANFPSRKKRY